MLEGCVTVIYCGVTVLFALIFVSCSVGGGRARLQKIDSLWPLLLIMASVVYLVSFTLTALAHAALCKV